MPEHYLNYSFSDTPEFVATFDELPLWSASFGLLLLKHLELKPNLTVLDIGSGAGFPLFEVAERLGHTSKCYGLDPWLNANSRARKKISEYGVNNVEIIDGTAAQIPFENDSVDLIISNLGINNFDDPDKVLVECNRVLKDDGRIALTTNLNGHWKEFYELFAQTLIQLNKHALLPELNAHCEHRGTVDSISKSFNTHNFKIARTFDEQFEMKFLNDSLKSPLSGNFSGPASSIFLMRLLRAI